MGMDRTNTFNKDKSLINNDELSKYDIMMEVYLSKEKAAQFNYNIEKCYKVIDDYFEKRNVKKISQGVYVGTEENDWSTFMIAAANLPDTTWFLNIVNEWYLRQEGLGESDREDCLKTYYRVERRNKR